MDETLSRVEVPRYDPQTHLSGYGRQPVRVGICKIGRQPITCDDVADCTLRYGRQMKHRRDPLAPPSTYRLQARKQQFHRAHRIAAACHVGVQPNFPFLGDSNAAVAVGAMGRNAIFSQIRRPISAAVNTLPDDSTFSSTTSAGVDMTP